jgi:hypothetical protein
MWNEGTFPAPLYLSQRRFAWTEEQIDAWIHERMAASRVKEKTSAVPPNGAGPDTICMPNDNEAPIQESQAAATSPDTHCTTRRARA